jgi:hypothetical protein
MPPSNSPATTSTSTTPPRPPGPPAAAYSPAPTTNRSTASSCAPPIPPATPPATPAGGDTIMRELLHVLDAEDQPLDDLHPDTIALYKKLLSTRALRT